MFKSSQAELIEIQNGTHPSVVAQLDMLKQKQEQRLREAAIDRLKKLELVELEFEADRRMILQELEEEKNSLKQRLIEDLMARSRGAGESHHFPLAPISSLWTQTQDLRFAREILQRRDSIPMNLSIYEVFVRARTVFT